jgi:hypothetical protein
MPQQERDKIDFVSGHYPYGLHRLFSRTVQYVSCVREPRERILSLYRFIKRSEDHDLNVLVNSHCHDFSTFLEFASVNELVWRDIDNVQVRLLSGDYDCRKDYETALAKALANVGRSNFLLGRLQAFTDLLDSLSSVTNIMIGAIEKANFDTEGKTVEDELAGLTPKAEEALEHFRG